MSHDRVYLDYAATTPVDPRVREAMLPFLGEAVFGNPSSLHQTGREAKKHMEQARRDVAAVFNVQPECMIWTSGATEANNLAIDGVARAMASAGRHMITTVIEHAAVLEPFQRLERRGWSVTYLPVDAEGMVSLTELAAAIRPDTVLLSVMHGNNEIGTLQSVEAIGRLAREKGVLFHTDAVQTAGKLPLDLAVLPIDYLSLSAHKLYGPKGVGALYVRPGTPLPEPLQVGGGQENALRSGTENLPGIVGLAKALILSAESMPEETPRLRRLQADLIAGIQALAPDAVLNGPGDVQARVPGNVHVSFPPGEGEALVLHFDLKGISVSSGSACHSAVIEPSRVVRALGKPDDVARATVRFSLGRYSTEADVQKVLDVLPGLLQRLQNRARTSAR